MFILIPLTQNRYVSVSAEDSDLAENKWRFNHGYATRHKPNSGQRHEDLRMHRVILERMMGRELLPDEIVDHKDGDSLNNQRYNLRLATQPQNRANQHLSSANTSGFKGIVFDGRYNVWVAHIQYNGKGHHLGHYATAEEAAKAYNDAAIKHFGEFAKPNDIPSDTVAHRIKNSMRKTNTSGYKGVSFHTGKKRWSVSIYLNGKRHHLGDYGTPEEAARVYDVVASTQQLPSPGMRRTNTSGYRGVSFKKEMNKWSASISYNRRQIHLGYFSTPQEAAHAYNQAAIQYHGNHALLNDL